MAEPADTVFRFGDFRYDPAQRLLFRDDELIPLQPKAVDLLELLLRRRGEAISKDELMRALWPDRVVEEIGLARNVSMLRKALGENAQCYIETVPKRGLPVRVWRPVFSCGPTDSIACEDGAVSRLRGNDTGCFVSFR